MAWFDKIEHQLRKSNCSIVFKSFQNYMKIKEEQKRKKKEKMLKSKKSTK